MDSLLQSIGALSDGPSADIAQLMTTLKQAQTQMKNYNIQQLDQALVSLDFQKHSLGVLFFLCAKADIISAVDVGNFCAQTQTFLKDCDAAQIKQDPTKFCRLCRKFTGTAIDQKNFLGAVKPLRTAISKLSASTEHLTPVHVDFVQICLLAKCYHASAEMISQPKFEVDPRKTALAPLDLLRYFYYSGMLHIGLKQFQEAFDALQMCVTAPASVLSEVFIAAYKKLVLVSLIVDGQLPTLPKYVSPVVQRQIKGATNAYNDLGSTFKTLEMAELQKVTTEHKELFTKDGNFGLVKQCLAALTERRILRLTSTYLTLSLHDIAQNAGLADAREAEAHVLAMVKDRKIFAKIDQSDGMVIFEEDSQLQDEKDMLDTVNAQILHAVALSERLQNIDSEVSSMPHYLSKQSSAQGGKTPGGQWAEETIF